MKKSFRYTLPQLVSSLPSGQSAVPSHHRSASRQGPPLPQRGPRGHGGRICGSKHPTSSLPSVQSGLPSQRSNTL